MEHAHKEETEIERGTRLRRHELRELELRRATRNWRAEKEPSERQSIAKLDIYASRKHLS